MKQVTLLFLRREDEILLAMKKRGFGAGKWNGVGGKLDSGESFAAGAIRECQEEIGVTPKDVKLIGHIQFYDTLDHSFHNDCQIFISWEWQGEPTETEEMRPQWFKLSDIPYDDMWADDRIWLPYLLAETPFAGDVILTGDKLDHHTIKTLQSIDG